MFNMLLYYFLLVAWCFTFPVARAGEDEGPADISAELGKPKMMEIKEMMRGLALKATSVYVSQKTIVLNHFVFLFIYC